jgi:hypothetical protein
MDVSPRELDAEVGRALSDRGGRGLRGERGGGGGGGDGGGGIAKALKAQGITSQRQLKEV